MFLWENQLLEGLPNFEFLFVFRSPALRDVWRAFVVFFFTYIPRDLVNMTCPSTPVLTCCYKNRLQGGSISSCSAWFFFPFVFFSFAFIFAVKLTSDAEFACSSVGQLYLVTHASLPLLFRFFFPIEAITMCSVNSPAFRRAFLNISLIRNHVYIHVD